MPVQSAAGLSQAPYLPAKQGTSINWSGYVAETSLSNPQSGVVTDVKGNWVVPNVTGSYSSGSGYSCIWVGIDGYTDKTVKQTGTVEQIGTEQDWVNGNCVYYAWYEMYPKPSVTIKQLPISAGDNITAEVQYTNEEFVLTLRDEHWAAPFVTTEKTNKALQNSAEWIVEAPWLGGILSLAKIGTVTFTGESATISNVAGPIDNWPYVPITTYLLQ